MRIRAFLLWMTLSGCGLVSGLDTLHVGDASADATIDASDAADESDAFDGATSTDAATDGAGIRCGDQVCIGLVCCVGPNGSAGQFTCAKDNCSNGDVTLRCDDKSDCTNSVGQVCCYSSSGSSCGLASGSCVALCNGDGQCGNNTKCVPFDAGAGLALSRCQ